MQYKMNCFREFFPCDIQKVVVKALTDNGFFLHKENLVVGMLASTDEQERIKAYLEIMESRRNNVTSRRVFRIPKLIYVNAQKLSEVTSDKLVIEPPILKGIDDDQLMQWAQNGGFSVPYECHSQVIDITL
ncbi:MAG: hypothetical protein GY739_07635 [Mesoflavibacter sp.]|nr:hypothetical protein [Mesoflavibacter sp.]